MKINYRRKKTKKNKCRILIFIAIFLITISIPLAVDYIYRYNDNDNPHTSNVPRHSSSFGNTYSPVSPSVSPQDSFKPASTVPTHTEPIETSTPEPVMFTITDDEQLTEYLSYLTSVHQGKYGISFLNMDTDLYIGINDKQPYVAASSTKVPFVMYVYHAVEKGLLDFDDLIEYTEDDFEEGTGIILNGEFGDEYTLKELTDYSILYSDNCAVNMLIRICGERKMVDYMNSLGATIDYIYVRWKTCPYDMMLYFKELIRLYDRNEEFYGQIVQNLLKNNFAYYMSSRSVLPSDVAIGLKTGINVSLPTYNETSVVFAKNRYILSYCSTDIDLDESPEILKLAAKTVYEFINNGTVDVEWDDIPESMR